MRFGLYNPEVYMDYWATTRQMKNDCEMWANSQLSHDVICGAYAARVEARLNERACGADPFICLAKLGLLVFAGAGMVTAAGAAPAAIGTVSCAGACLTAANGIAHGAILGGAAGFFGYLGGGVAGNMAGGRDPREGLNVRDMLMAMAQGALAGGVVGGIAPLGLSLPGMKTAPALSGAAWAMGLFAGSISATRSWLSRGSRVSRSARRTQFQ